MKPADELAELWAADSLNMEAIEAVDITAWRTYQLVYFLDQVLQKSPLPEGEGKVTSRGFCAQGRHEVMHPGPASWPGTGGHISGTCGCMAISPSPTAVQQGGSWCLGSLSQCGEGWRARASVSHVWGHVQWQAVPRLAQLGCHLPVFTSPCALCCGTSPHSCWHPKPLGMWLCRAAWCQEPSMGTLLPGASECLGCSQSWGHREAWGGPGLAHGWEDPRGFAAQPGWTQRVPSEQGLGAGGRAPKGAMTIPPLAGNVETLSKMYPKISKAQNAELRLRWCQIILKNNLEAEYSKVKDFLHSQVCPWAAVAVPSSVPLF